MNLYKLKQTVNNDYDTYDSCIVAAENEEEAIRIKPNGTEFVEIEGELSGFDTWCIKLKDVQCELIGTAVKGTKKCVILASFNAG